MTDDMENALRTALTDTLVPAASQAAYEKVEDIIYRLKREEARDLSRRRPRKIRKPQHMSRAVSYLYEAYAEEAEA